MELGSEPQGTISRCAARRRSRPVASTRRLAGTCSPPRRRSRPRPRLPAGHDRPTSRRSGPPGRPGRSPRTDETRPRRTSRGRAHARAGAPRRRATRGGGDSAARLALENERLQAEVQARLEELRASRARIVEAGDAERKRLERDLHDGAQQRLVGLSLSLRLARAQLETAGPSRSCASTRPTRSCAKRSQSSASSRTGSSLPCSPTRVWQLLSRRSPRRGEFRPDPQPARRTVRAPSRRRPTRSWRRRRGRPRRRVSWRRSAPECAPRRVEAHGREWPRRRRPRGSPRRARRPARRRARATDGGVTIRAELPCES